MRCRAVVDDPERRRRSAARTAAAAAGALLLVFPAVLLPILEVERLGHRSSSSLLLGTVRMIVEGEWLIGGVVLVFSIVFPIVKIVLLLELSVLGLLRRRHRAVTHRVVELTGKWSMMDVMLIAFLVMLVKVGDLVEFHVGPAAVAFVLCVGMSLLASLCFDPHAIWEEDRSL